MDVTFETLHEEKSWGDNQYSLHILIDGKGTGIVIEAGSGGGSVESTVTLFYEPLDDFFVEGTVFIPSDKPFHPIRYNINIKGTIKHLKNHVVENIIDILNTVNPHIQSLKDKINSSANVIQSALKEDGFTKVVEKDE